MMESSAKTGGSAGKVFGTFAAVVILNVLLAFPVLFQTYKHFGETLTPMDVEVHLKQVDQGPTSVYPPFKYRVLTPWVVRAMRPLPGYDIAVDFSGSPAAKKDFFHFLMLNFALTVLASGMLFLYLRRHLQGSLGGVFAYLGSLLYLFSFFTVTANFIPMSDAACHLAIITAIWFFDRGRPWGLTLTCLIGVFAKETVLIVLVPWIVAGAFRSPKRLAYLACLLPALLGYLALNRLVPAVSEQAYSDPSYLLANLARVFDPATYSRTFLFQLVLGFLPLVAAFAGFLWLRWRRGVRVPVNPEMAVFFGLLWLGISMGIENNAARVAFMAFPAVALFQARVLEALARAR